MTHAKKSARDWNKEVWGFYFSYGILYYYSQCNNEMNYRANTNTNGIIIKSLPFAQHDADVLLGFTNCLGLCLEMRSVLFLFVTTWQCSSGHN